MAGLRNDANNWLTYTCRQKGRVAIMIALFFEKGRRSTALSSKLGQEW